MIPEQITNPKGCLKEIKALGDIFYCGQDIGINKIEVYYCQECKNIQKAQVQTLLDEKKSELIDNVCEQEYLEWIFGFLKDIKGIDNFIEVTKERLENIKKKYQELQEEIKVLEEMLK